MSFEGPGRTSFDYTPRASLDATYPSHLAHAGSWSGQGGSWGAQLSSVPEQFPLINAPPPPSSWGAAGRFSLDSGTDRISADMSRMSFEAPARWAGWLAFWLPGTQARSSRRAAVHSPLSST